MQQYYRHFKGNIYKVLYIAKHSETLEDYVGSVLKISNKI